MLNKIKIIGAISINKEKKEDIFPVSQETANEKDEKQSKSELGESQHLFFSVDVLAPNGALNILRCVAQGEIAKRIIEEIQEKELVEIRGYLRNEKQGRQIIIKVLEFKKLELNFDGIDKKNANQLRLIGKIITDLQNQDPEIKQKSEMLSFKLAVPREGIQSPLFFCRVNEKELIPEFKKILKKGDIILLEGFLQTQKIISQQQEKPKRISAIICYGFTLLDNDSVNIFNPLDNLTRVVKEVSEIDFSKPKNKASLSQQVE